MIQGSPPNGYTEITNANTTWPKDAAIDAHWGVEKVFDYWRSPPRNRNSLDNAGMTIIGYVHWNQGQNADNAHWDGNEMLYGDGNTTFNPVVSLDVIAHETGHAIMQYSANFSTSSGQETQSLNEGLSDIWGAVIENWVAPDPINNWLICEQIMRNGRQCLRSLRSPKLEGYNSQTQTYPGGYPNTYQKTYWVNVSNCQIHNPDDNDHCSCHTNSTVLSHWFYLLSQGGSGTNDIPNSYSVYGVGINYAASIVWHAESVNLPAHPNAQYSDVVTQTIQAATDLSSANSLEVMQVKNAWYAVGLGSQPTQMTLIGPNFFCSTGTFSISNVPTGCTVLWSASSNITLPSNKNTNPIVATVNGNGPGWLLATVSSSTCSASVQYTVWVGTPVLSISGPSSGCTNNTYNFTASPTGPYANESNYTWNLVPLNGNYLSPYGYQNNSCAITFYNPYSASGYSVQSRAQNSCGIGGYGTTNIYIHNCYMFSLSPNPASETVTVTKKVLGGTDNSVYAPIYDDLNTIYSIRILDFYGSLCYSTTKSGDSFTFPVSSLKDGNYIVQIIDGKDVYNIQLIVKH
jgi:hypothetical protein